MKVNFAKKTVGGFNFEFARGISTQAAGAAEFGECMETLAAAPGAGRRDITRKVLVVLGVVITLQALFALCFVSAQQLLTPRDMPFGVAGPPSQVVAAVTSKVGLDPAAYPNQSAAMDAINQGKLYGAYVTGRTSDTLIVVPAKSFFGQVEIEGAFLDAAHKLGRRSRCRRPNRCRPATRSAG
jgi:hypothetical protein